MSANKLYQAIRVDVIDSVGHLLHPVERLNALSKEMLLEIDGAMTVFERQPEVRVIVLMETAKSNMNRKLAPRRLA